MGNYANIPERLIPAYRVTQETVQLSANAPVRVQEISLSGAVAPHDHDFFEVFLVRSGTGEHRSAHGITTLIPGSVTLLAPGHVHAIQVRQPMEGINLYFLSEWLLGETPPLAEREWIFHWILARTLFGNQGSTPPVQFTLPQPALRELVRDLQEIDQERRRDQASRWFLHVTLIRFLIRLSRSPTMGRSTQPLPHLPVGRCSWKVMEAVEEQLRRGERIALAPLARQCGMTRDHLARVFRRETGVTPLAYYQRRRIQVAASQLLRQDRAITEIAHALGFTDSAHFSRNFRQFQGETPREYRRRFSLQANNTNMV